MVLIGIVAIPGYKPAYNDQLLPAEGRPGTNIGFAAADRHFSQARMNPDILMVNSEHDMRNPADMLVLNTVARNVLHTEGIALVQSITRPLGIPIQHSSIPFQTSIQGQTSNQNLPFQRDQLANQLKTVDSMNLSIKIAEEQYQLSLEQTKLTQESDAKSKDLLASTEALRDHIADFDDEFRPLRAYFYWEPHCFDIPMCFAIRSLFDSLDGIDATTELTGEVQVNTDRLADIAPKLTALLPQTLASMKTSRDLALSTYNSQKALYDQQEASNDTALAMGQAFDNAKNDDLFFLPPEAFTNPDFERGLKLFMSPDGKSARMFITHEGDPATVEGINRVDSERKAAQEALKMSSLSDAKVYLGGVAATYRDMADGAKYDLLIAVVSALTLIFMIMLILTRSCGGGSGHRDDGRQLDRRVVRHLGAAVAGPLRQARALAGHADVGDHPAGGGIGLQPAAGVAVQGRDPRRPQDRHHQVHGRDRWRRHLGRTGVRGHHGSDDVQQADRAGNRWGRRSPSV